MTKIAIGDRFFLPNEKVPRECIRLKDDPRPPFECERMRVKVFALPACYFALQFLYNGDAPCVAELLKVIRYIMKEASEELRCLPKYINNIQTVFFLNKRWISHECFITDTCYR